MWTGLSNSLASDSPVPGPFFACVLWPPGCSPVSFASPKTLSSLHPLLHRHPGEGRRRFTTAKLVIQRLALRSPLEAGFVTASYLPVCSRDRAAYATGVSFAYRHESHVLFASRKSLSPLPPLPTSSSRRRPGSSALPLRRTSEAGFVTASYLPVCFRDRAAYAAGVSNACRRPSHFLFAGPRLRVAHANGEAGPEGGGPLGPE